MKNLVIFVSLLLVSNAYALNSKAEAKKIRTQLRAVDNRLIDLYHKLADSFEERITLLEERTRLGVDEQEMLQLERLLKYELGELMELTGSKGFKETLKANPTRGAGVLSRLNLVSKRLLRTTIWLKNEWAELQK